MVLPVENCKLNIFLSGLYSRIFHRNEFLWIFLWYNTSETICLLSHWSFMKTRKRLIISSIPYVVSVGLHKCRNYDILYLYKVGKEGSVLIFYDISVLLFYLISFRKTFVRLRYLYSMYWTCKRQHMFSWSHLAVSYYLLIVIIFLFHMR